MTQGGEHEKEQKKEQKKVIECILRKLEEEKNAGAQRTVTHFRGRKKKGEKRK